jgi:hypothetical protein
MGGASRYDLIFFPLAKNNIRINQEKRTDSAAVCKINYTSKIRTFEDMSSLRSYGFRGEALWGILRLGKVHITSRTNQSDVGWHSTYTRDGVTEPSSIAAAKGTTIKVDATSKLMLCAMLMRLLLDPRSFTMSYCCALQRVEEHS